MLQRYRKWRFDRIDRKQQQCSQFYPPAPKSVKIAGLGRRLRRAVERRVARRHPGLWFAMELPHWAVELARTELEEQGDRRQRLIRLGHRSYIHKPARIAAYRGDPTTPITIGAYCSISENVEFVIGGNHHPEWGSTFPFRAVLGLPGAFSDGQPASRGPITIGNDVWIGKNAVLLSGVTVADGAVIGANAVVARDVRPYAIMVGNPAQEVRRRFTDEQIDRLLAVRWWDWPEDEIVSVVGLLNGASVDDLLRYASKRR